MLADTKPETKLEPDLPNTKPQERPRFQTPLPPNNITNNGNNSQKPDVEPVVNFGWEPIENGPLIPFIKRGSEDYVANHIVAELVYKRIEQQFSKEMLFCMAILMVKMTQKEADTFNEINIQHCDKKIVGNYYFKANEFMIKLEYVLKLVEYYWACQNLILNKIKENKLFGFIQIAGKNQVPFVWDGDQKLVPLFYFEGQSDYLDARAIDLTEPFKIGYLKFCCKVQKIRKDFYEQNPLKVVDVDDVKKLFPDETTFELCLPNKVNHDILAPEVRLALLYGEEDEIQVPKNNTAVVSSRSQNFEEEINNNTSEKSSVIDQGLSKPNSIDSPDAIPKSPSQTKENDNESANKTLKSEFLRYKEHMRLNRKRAQDSSAQRPAQVLSETKRRKMDMAQPGSQSKNMLQEASVETHTVKPTGNSALHQRREVQTANQIKNPQQSSPSEDPLKSLDLSRLSQDCIITPIYHQEIDRRSGVATITPVSAVPRKISQDMGTRRPNYPHQETDRRSEVATITPVSAVPRRISQDMGRPRTTSPNQITNVPHSSPRTASSPGSPYANPIINEATQRATITPITEVTNKSINETSDLATEAYQPGFYLPQENQFAGGTVRTHPQIQKNANLPQRNSTPYYAVESRSNTSTSNFSGPIIYQNTVMPATSPQVHSYPPAPNINVHISRQNQRNSQLQNTLQSELWRKEQHQRALESRQQAFPPNFFSRLPQEAVRQYGPVPLPPQQVVPQSYSVPSQFQHPSHRASSFPFPAGIPYNNQNLQNQPALTGHQPNSSYYQYENPTAFNSQNVSVKNYPVSQNFIPNGLSAHTSSDTSMNTHCSQDINNNAKNLPGPELKVTIIEHPHCIDPIPDFYAIKICAVKNKVLLGISKSPIAHSYLVNLSEYVEKVLGLNPFGNRTELTFRFKSLYRLNPIQKVRWETVVKENKFEFVGPFKELFVELSEVLSNA